MNNLTPDAIGLLGIVVQILVSYQGLRVKAKIGSVPFDWGKYWELDKIIVMISLCSVILWHFFFPELSAKYTWLTTIQVISFGCVGFVGSYAIQKAGGASRQWIDKFIDSKTNAVDHLMGASKTPEEAKVKEMIAKDQPPII